MADFIALRKGRNALSTVLHISLNIALAVISTALTVISGSWIFGVMLVLLSKWRVIAVRPRYWWINIKANLVDFVVGVSLVFLVYAVGREGWNIWHTLLTLIYTVWLIFIKPRSEALMTEVQAMFALFFGTFATAIMTAQFDPLLGVLFSFIIGYGASRHVLIQSDDHDFTLTTFICGLMVAELSWIFYYRTIAYSFGEDVIFAIPQLPIVVCTLFFLFARGYKSALRHDGKIRADDVIAPAIFSVSLMFVMVFFYSMAGYNV